MSNNRSTTLCSVSNWWRRIIYHIIQSRIILKVTQFSLLKTHDSWIMVTYKYFQFLTSSPKTSTIPLEYGSENYFLTLEDPLDKAFSFFFVLLTASKADFGRGGLDKFGLPLSVVLLLASLCWTLSSEFRTS